MNKVISRTKRGAEWDLFADRVLTHINTYTIPQYGDKGEDEIDDWSTKDCMLAIKKYTARFGRSSRRGQERLDMMKIAHYACFVYNKLKEENNAVTS